MPQSAAQPATSLRRRVFEVIELGRGDDRASRAFDAVIIFFIVANIFAFCAETVPEYQERWGRWFAAFEALSLGVFTVEYALRLWTAVEMPFLKRLPSWRARLHFARRPFMIFDLVAILPFFLGGLVGMDLRVLRALRLLRLFKLSRYSPAMHTLLRVLQNEGRALTGAGILLLTVLLFSATGMYFIEGHVQPDKLGTVPLAAYWAMTTLTTVGYGDVFPVTPLGRAWAMLTMLCGLCVLALPVAIISTGFAQETTRRDFVVTWSLMARIPLFVDLDAGHIAELMPILHAQNLPPNVEIAGSGSLGGAVWFIAAGRVGREGAGEPTMLVTGGVLGAAALLERMADPARYVTRSRCRLLKLYREDFQRLEATAPAAAQRLREVASREHETELARQEKVADELA